MLYQYTNTRQPTPGAMSYAFHMRYSLPVFTPFTPGVPYKPYYNPLQPPQLYYNLRVKISGYGGPQFAGIATQGLSMSQLGGGSSPAFG